MLVGTNTQLVQLPQQLGFSFPACVGGDEAEAVVACRDGRELFPETPGRFRGIAPELIPGGEAVVRARRSCILGRQDRDRAPVRKANLLRGDRRRTCERGIRLNEFHQRGEHSPLGLLEIIRDNEELVWTLLRKCPPEGEGRVDRRLTALLWGGVDDGVV